MDATSLYAQYIKEREGIELVQVEHGFATYQKINSDLYYLVDIFVEQGFRKSGIATKLSSMICEVALKNGAKQLLGSVDISRKGVTESMSAILADGFRYSHSEGNGIYFLKDIGE